MGEEIRYLFSFLLSDNIRVLMSHQLHKNPRSLGRGVCQGEYCLVYYKPYGNGPSSAILKTLSSVSKMRVLPALRIGLAKSKGVLMFSPTKHNNVFASGNYYADHHHEFDKKSRRIGIYVEDNSITNSDVEKEHGELMLTIDRIVSSALRSPFLHVSGCVA